MLMSGDLCGDGVSNCTADGGKGERIGLILLEKMGMVMEVMAVMVLNGMRG